MLRSWVRRLRTPAVFRALRDDALRPMLQQPGFRICHLSIQHNHLHLLVEARDRVALAKGMQRFAIRAARAVHRALGIRGKIWTHRYHATAISTQRQAWNTLLYVLCNWRKHAHDRDATMKGRLLDPYSSAHEIEFWRGKRKITPIGYLQRLPVRPASTQLLRSCNAWGPLDPTHIPSMLFR